MVIDAVVVVAVVVVATAAVVVVRLGRHWNPMYIWI